MAPLPEVQAAAKVLSPPLSNSHTTAQVLSQFITIDVLPGVHTDPGLEDMIHSSLSMCIAAAQ